MSTLGRLLRIETLKTRKRVALWVTAGIFAFIAAMVVVVPLVMAVSSNVGGPPFALPFIWRGALQFPVQVGPLFLAVLTILLAAREFGWKTARQNVIDGLSREQFYLGKVLLLALLVVLFLLIPLVVTPVAALVSPHEGTGTIAASEDLNFMLAYLLALALWGSLGLMLAVLIRGAGGAIGALLLYYIVENMVVGVLTLWRPELERYLDFLPVQLNQMLARLEMHYPDALAETNDRLAQFGQGPLELPAFGVVAGAILAWAALFLGLAFANARRRDL